MLHYRSDPRKVFKSYAYAASAQAEGVNFYYFTPGKVNLRDKKIIGKVLENGEWIDREMPFPDVIYNAGSPLTEKADEIHTQLEKQIPFTSHSIGDKISVYERLKKGKQFIQHLIPTTIINDYNQLDEHLVKYGKIILKPVSGHKGIGVLLIKKTNSTYSLMYQDHYKEFDKEEIERALTKLFKIERYLVQPYIECRTKNGNAYDFRLHVQKNGSGEWVTSAVYVKIAPSTRSIVTNLNSGGYTMYLDLFLKREFGDQYFNIRRNLEYFSVVLARHMDELYNHQLDELGIDVGLDSNRKIWIYEINWRPGAAPVFNLEIDIARNTIRYAIYLAKRGYEKKVYSILP
jgi:glutathione synthase/RimK-type ligase-like ATP-grasp enzyme